MNSILYRADQRGRKDQGWLISNFTFSFSSFYDPARAGFGLLRTFNDDFVKPGNGFGLHGHTNMEIISVMLSGEMNHLDSMGYREKVSKDWVQIMSAGSGLRHEEHNIGKDDVNFLQIWIEPKIQNITPRYQKRYFPESERKNKLVTIVSNEEGLFHCWINQNAKLSLGYFDPGQTVSYPLSPLNKCVFVFLISGQLTIGPNKLQERDSIGIWNTDRVEIQVEKESRFLVIETPVNH